VIIRYVKAEFVPVRARVQIGIGSFRRVIGTEPAGEGKVTLHFWDGERVYANDDRLPCDLGQVPDPDTEQLAAAAAKLAPLIASRHGAGLHGLAPIDADAGLHQTPLSAIRPPTA
jgi:hypothetical protein